MAATSRGVTFIGWREVEGWQYGRLAEPGENSVSGIRCMCSLSSYSRADCERSMRNHLAQYVTTPDDTDVPEGTILNADDAKEHRRWLELNKRARSVA
jgi:hypothetical protein